MKCQRSRRISTTGFRVWVCPSAWAAKVQRKRKKNSVPTTWNKYKTVEANSTNDVCAKWVCVWVCLYVCDVGVVGNSASCAANQLMMLLTLPQPAELDKQQLSEKRQWERGKEWRGEALGCQRVSPLAAYIGWAALEHNFQEICQYLTSRHCRCHCALPVFHFFLSLFSFSSFPFFCWCFLRFFLYWS